MFSMEELEATLNCMSPSKAPGPDGLNMGVLKALWGQIKQEVFDFFVDFYHSGTIPGGLNSSFIALIPKIKGAKQITDFMPISLMNCVMKLLTKVLASRLRGVMDMLISENQTVFIKGRQMTEGILLMSEMYASLRAKNSEGVILKLDFTKAFDTVN